MDEVHRGAVLQIQNAGLVLTAAYLPQLFYMSGCMEDGQFVSMQKRALAVRLLDYVAFGNKAPAHEFVFNKLLCEFQNAQLSDFPGELAATQKDAAEGMINAMIHQWDIIGNTSPEEVRNTFLCRPGTLVKGDNDWKLTVEPGPFDMLLDRLPWSFNLVKLPWLACAISVNWR